MRFLLPLATIALLLFAAPSAFADGPAKKKTASSSRPKKVAFDVKPHHETTAKQFVEQYHPELANLLTTLKMKRPKAYHGAVRDLYRSSQRLENIRSHDMVRYELELRLWTVRSRIQLMSARLKVQDSPEFREKLRQSLDQQIDLRIALLQHQQAKMSRSLEKIETQLKKLENNRSQEVERQLQRLTFRRKPKPRKSKPKSKPATKK